jgi:hypothetical protein
MTFSCFHIAVSTEKIFQLSQVKNCFKLTIIMKGVFPLPFYIFHSSSSLSLTHSLTHYVVKIERWYIVETDVSEACNVKLGDISSNNEKAQKVYFLFFYRYLTFVS